jgi:1-aminocyclopropane-1-carboxylate deaminase
MIEINSYLRLDYIKNDITEEFGIVLYLLRLDLIHPVVSGNKLFKLHYFIEQAKLNNVERLITFGGAYSNHLIATAYYANKIDITLITDIENT